MVPFCLATILKHLQKEDIENLLDWMDDMAITNEMIKEHLTCLCLDQKLPEKLNDIEPRIKAAFTRAYNREMAQIKRVGKGVSAKDSKVEDGKEEEESDVSDVDEDRMLDEDELAEIKAARKAEKDRKREEKKLYELEQKQREMETKYKLQMDSH